MKRIGHLDELNDAQRDGALSIGNFDGVHRGHARLIQRLLHHAHRISGPAVVFTFDPHPATFLRPDNVPPPLTAIDRKCELLGQLGVDVVVTYPTTRELLSLSAEQFFAQIVVDRLSSRAIVEGPNFFFGKDRTGDIDRLAQLCQQHGRHLEIVPPVSTDDGGFISSSRIRRDLLRGDVTAASDKLGRPHRIAGQVVRGEQRGRELGFPTANLNNLTTLAPGVGVYAGRATLHQTTWPAAVHVGPTPTFSDRVVKVEVHLIDYDCTKDLYGKTVEVDFLARLRDIHTFVDVESLTKQLHTDVAAAREAFQR